MWAVRNDGDLTGYAASTFSTFTVADFDPDVAPIFEVTNGTKYENITECRYNSA